MPRFPAIDRLRAVALVLMLMHHFTKWLAGHPRRILPGWEGFAITDLAAPAFVTAAGASAWLFTEGRRRRGDGVLPTVVRRYGLLIPMGIALQTWTSHAPWEWGVLQTLGAAVIGVIVLTRRLPPLPFAVLALIVGPLVEHHFAGKPGYLAEIFGGTFPLVTYLGFALFGAAGAVLLTRNEHRGVQAMVAGLGLIAVAGVIGQAPDRYPGDVTFVIPAMAGTLILFGMVERWSLLPRSLGNHTLGIFLAHYVAFYAINRFDLRGKATPLVAVLVGMTSVAVFALVAPHVPQPPWSLRTGWRPQKRVASSAA